VRSSRVAKLIKAPAETLASLEAAQKETQFSKSLDLIKDAMPESLRIQGHNPMTLLHDNLSTGLHSKTDAECLEIAQAIRVILAELAERLSTALKDEAELTKALGKLLNNRSRSKKLKGNNNSNEHPLAKWSPTLRCHAVRNKRKYNGRRRQTKIG